MTESTRRPPDAGLALPLGRQQMVDGVQAFDEGGGARWEDSARLAARFGMTPEGQERQVAWHHLLMSVGNFKRQTPIHLAECLGHLSEGLPNPPPAVDVPGGGWLARDDTSTWKALTDIRGLGVATATTLLSALWPGEHVVIDRFAWSAAVGLRASEGLNSRGIDPEDNGKLPEIAWGDYEEYLSWVLATGNEQEVEPRDVERTLYRLGAKVRGEAGRSWKAYGDVLKQRLGGPI